MVIDVKMLARQGKEIEEVYFEFPLSEDLLISPEMKLISGKFSGNVYLEDKIYLKGQLTFTISGPCSRCLKESVCEVEVEVDEVYSERPQEDEYRYKSGLVDITEMINDKVLANQPSVLLCDKECKGLCPKCGCNLNEEDCSCEK